MARSGTSGKKKFQARLITLVAADDVALRLLEHTKGSAGTQFEKRLRELAKEADPSGNCTSTTATRTFVNWCKNAPSVPRPLSSALARRATRTGKANREEYLADIEVKVVKPLRKPYPPPGHIVAESDSAHDAWFQFMEERPIPDKRKAKLAFLRLQKKKLAVNVACDESVIFKTTKGKLVAGVLRDFCPSEEVVKWVDTIIAEALPKVTNIRKEDPGKLSQVGYTAGSLSQPAFHWARNLVEPKLNASAAAEMDAKSSSVFALLWQMARSRLPKEVIDDFDTFLAKSGIKRMDGSGQMASEGSSGTYSVVVGGTAFDFHDVELAPPTGVFGQNYSRGIHFEHQPHMFALAWTVSRNKRPDAGGNFYLAKYGIRVEAAPNTLVFWMPAELHGTSLLDHSPYDAAPDFIQRGAAIVTSNRLPGVWKKYRANEVTREEALAELMEASGEIFDKEEEEEEGKEGGDEKGGR
ncbi:hypothetical protein FPV67DRAFT_1682217 [Lyophyllum atratum]|nr:hypothetical protein FPV67DRAFT_1682217 [Lyophyllum atratum]